jgi:hypothetical protein
MSRSRTLCAVTGWGAVSPAGWNASDLRDAMLSKAELPIRKERRCEGAPERQVRPVPAHPSPPDWMKQPRFRRSSAIARYATHAAMEALGETRAAKVRSGEWSVGVVFCSMNGGVHFSRCFYAEVLENPSVASPILFPETVYNAPSSHIAALLGATGMNYTLVGDSAQFVAALDLASQWLEDGLADACLVVAAEELDWVTDEALPLFGKKSVAAEGATAVLLEPRTQLNDTTPLLQLVTPARTYGARMSRYAAASLMWQDLFDVASKGAVLCDGLGAGPRVDRVEKAACLSWKGERVSARRVLGEGFSVTSGWQTIAALEWLREGRAQQALVSAVGLSQQAVGAAFGFDLRVGVTEKAMQVPRTLEEKAVPETTGAI